MPFVHLIICFHLFHGPILYDFNIVLIPGTQRMIAQMVTVFGIGVELLCSVKNVLVEEQAIDFFLMFVRFDMLNI